ncbi:hypothetical protein AB0C96_08980 [Streptomyces sp. NPDC048506]|uniref:TetR family transcriptional regulator C-terminal domain-containing protein n=1 Tax=Streptomyces sp. NPDC048506 TaxID=3155028 RepID=UPI0034458C3A
MPLTRKGAATRQRIIEGAADQIREQGVFAVRLEDVMARTATLHAALAQLGGTTDATRTVAGELLGRWQQQLAAGIAHMQGSGEVAPGLDADQEAAALLAGIQGGVLILMTTGGSTYPPAPPDACGSPPVPTRSGVCPRSDGQEDRAIRPWRARSFAVRGRPRP